MTSHAIGPFLAADRPLTDVEIGRLNARQTWRMTTLDPWTQRVTQTAAGRAVAYKPALFTATKTNYIMEDISEQMERGEVTLDLDLDGSKMSFSATMRRKREIRPLQDFVAPFLKLIYEDGSVDYEQVGLFVLMPAIAHHYPSDSFYEIDGRDLGWLLDANQTPVTVDDTAGMNPIDRAKVALNSVGLTRQSIPLGGPSYTKAVSWGPGTSLFKRINDRFLTAGYYALWFDRHGVATSRPYDDLSTAQPAVRYTSDTGSKIVPPIDEEPDWTRVCNRVVVLGTDPAADQIVAVRENNDPTSPASYQNLGNQWITRTIEAPEIQTQTAADAMAENVIREGASFYRTLTLQTLPDPTRNPREVYELDIRDRTGTQLVSGKWRCSGWTLPLDWNDPVMTHDLSRVEPVQVTTP